MDEAKAIYDDITDYAMTAMYANGLDPDEVSESFKRFSREVFIYDHLSGAVTPGGYSHVWRTAAGRLTFWRLMLKYYAPLQDHSPELWGYIVERVKEAVRGI